MGFYKMEAINSKELSREERLELARNEMCDALERADNIALDPRRSGIHLGLDNGRSKDDPYAVYKKERDQILDKYDLIPEDFGNL
jgi:hypothetical protein